MLQIQKPNYVIGVRIQKRGVCFGHATLGYAKRVFWMDCEYSEIWWGPEVPVAEHTFRWPIPSDQKRCKLQAKHDDCSVKADSSLGSFLIFNCSDFGKPYVCNGSQQYVFYDRELKMQLVGPLKLQANDLPPCFIFLCNGYLQRYGADYLRYRHMRIHLYLIPGQSALDDICMRIDREWESAVLCNVSRNRISTTMDCILKTSALEWA